MTDTAFRKMKESDLEKVVAMEKEIFSDPWDFNFFDSDLKNEHSWLIVAEQDGEIVGYGVLYIVADELQIGNFGVGESFRRQGIGKKMMAEIIKIAAERSCDSIYLEVRESNKAAQALYFSFGFEAVGRRIGYYRNPRENAILMAKEL
jgi:[ribosomal protein S18]-alanine N-acetyltransferase